ncbi:MAG: L,D-transpeptidase/peptidoglycan binding protein [Lachnospiraceae bacterium]|nr:L,D-transpeptidase/peptidoglycan binding protein [Lachnospiraceae bacterium]
MNDRATLTNISIQGEKAGEKTVKGTSRSSKSAGGGKPSGAERANGKKRSDGKIDNPLASRPKKSGKNNKTQTVHPINPNPQRKNKASAGNSRRANKISSSNRSTGSRPVAKRGAYGAYDKEYKKTKANQGSSKWVGIAIAAIICVAAIAYTGTSIYFMERFFFNTRINGQDFSRKNTDDVYRFMQEYISRYELTIIERNGTSELIRGTDIAMRYHDNGEITQILDDQNPFMWIFALFGVQEIETEMGVEFDQATLDQKINQLQIVTVEQTQPVSARPAFDGQSFVITPEEHGNAVNMDRLREVIRAAVVSFQEEINIVDEDVYLQPRFTADSAEVIAAVETLNTYVGASITYTVGESVVVDKELISDWVSFDDDMNVFFDEDAVHVWLSEFAARINSHGTTRHLYTPTGRAVQVTGGYYGWILNFDVEIQALLGNIRHGETVTREPNYTQRAMSHGSNDWGSTFVQVDLSNQHMWYIVDGVVVFETPVVTGLPRDGRNTPEGVYFILEMSRNTILRGPVVNEATGEREWETPVAYWMRTTWSGIGFHDATWQPSFGGTRYLENGSQGCINMPLDRASQFYNMIHDLWVQTNHIPVVVHY